MIGQKFVYKFVSFPEILKMDPQAVEMGLASGRFPLQEGEAPELEVEEEEEEEGEEEAVVAAVAAAAQRRTLAALGAQQCRNDYLRSGLYSSFSISSLQNQPELLRALRERQDEPRSVIRFGTNASERSSPPTGKLESYISPRPHTFPPHSGSPSSPHAQPGRSWSPAVKEEEEEECDQSAQPLNLSSGHRERALQPPEKRGSSGRSSSTTSTGSSNQGDGLPPKSKKPKALEISAPSLLLAGSDIGSIALNSPALPSGSLTPAFFTAQVRSHREPYRSSAASCCTVMASRAFDKGGRDQSGGEVDLVHPRVEATPPAPHHLSQSARSPGEAPCEQVPQQWSQTLSRSLSFRPPLPQTSTASAHVQTQPGISEWKRKKEVRTGR